MMLCGTSHETQASHCQLAACSLSFLYPRTGYLLSCKLLAGLSEQATAFWSSQGLRDSLQHARTAFCIHNLAYQGFMPLATFPRLCLPETSLRPLLWPPLLSEGGCPAFIPAHLSIDLTQQADIPRNRFKLYSLSQQLLAWPALEEACCSFQSDSQPLAAPLELHGCFAVCCFPSKRSVGS